MKKNTLEKVYLSLRDLEPRLEMDDALMHAGARPHRPHARAAPQVGAEPAQSSVMSDVTT